MSELLKEKFFPQNLYKILYFLSKSNVNKDPIIIGTLKKKFENEISYPIINQTLSYLKTAGLIDKKDGKDRRKQLIELTEKGSNLLNILEDFKNFLG